jgi:hypothetical protein
MTIQEHVLIRNIISLVYLLKVMALSLSLIICPLLSNNQQSELMCLLF